MKFDNVSKNGDYGLEDNPEYTKNNLRNHNCSKSIWKLCSRSKIKQKYNRLYKKGFNSK